MAKFELRSGLTLKALRELDLGPFADWDLGALASHGRPSAPIFSAVWYERVRPASKRLILSSWTQEEPAPWTIGKDYVDAADYLGDLDKYEDHRVTPILVTATGDLRTDGETGVATTWVFRVAGTNQPNTSTSVISIVSDKLSDLVGSETANRQCTSLDAVWYKRAGNKKPEERYLGIFTNSPTAIFGMFATTVIPTLGVMNSPEVVVARQGYTRVHSAIPAPVGSVYARTTVLHMRGDTYAAWPTNQSDDFWGGTVTDGPMMLSQVQGNYETRRDQGLVPLQIGANGVGGQTRVCITWAPRRKPKKRYFRLVSGAVESDEPVVELSSTGPREETAFPEFDAPTNTQLIALREWLRERMTTLNIANAQIAIVSNGKLKVFWSLTLGERGWTVTQPFHKFRFASCQKIFTAIRAVRLGELFLNQPVRVALGLSNTTAPELSEPTIRDCLWHLSGLASGGKGSRKAYNAAWELGRRELPLQGGDLRRAFLNGAAESLVVRPPREFEAYNNTGYNVVGEAIALATQDNAERYFESMVDWWPVAQSLVRPIPESKSQAIDRGEIPTRSRICVGQNTFLSSDALDEAKNLGQVPGKVPAAYAFRDGLITGPAGGFTMSAATQARLFQMLHPAELVGGPSGVRLTMSQLALLASTAGISVARSASNTVPAQFSLGCRVRQTQSNILSRVRREFTWGGNWKEFQSGFAHFVDTDLSGDPTGSFTALWVVTGGTPLTPFNNGPGVYSGNVVRSTARDVADVGGWNNAVDLFQDLNLD